MHPVRHQVGMTAPIIQTVNACDREGNLHTQGVGSSPTTSTEVCICMTAKKPILLSDLPPCKPEVAEHDWECGPCGVTRDSTPEEECNFDVASQRLDAVDPHGETWEIIRWHHWAVGWVEEIFTKPGSEANKEARDMRAVLEEYPLLDEDCLAFYLAEDNEDKNDAE